MKPLATPVLGGMASSLLHVLIVTPVIFFWISERRLGLKVTSRDAGARRPVARRAVVVAAITVAAVAVVAYLWTRSTPESGMTAPPGQTVVQTVRAGELDVVLLAPAGALRQGRNAFTFEFRRAGTETLADVGTVRASAYMPMPGMVMSGGLQVEATPTPGRYSATAEFGMAGAWRMAIEWAGPAGSGSVSFEGGVQ